MTNGAGSLPSRKWSIVALASAGMATVIFSYLLAIAFAIGCLVLPILLLVTFPVGEGGNIISRLLVSAFCVVVALTILWSLIPENPPFDANGVRIDLARQPRLAAEIKAIATTLREPMPSEVFVVADANAFVTEIPGPEGKRRILALGLPLLQMLSIAQFRAVLAHEFAHYYAGDTRLGPSVYNTRRAMSRVYENLGRKSKIMGFLRQWGVIAGLYSILMGALRAYWKIFMRITQAISRRQEIRSDELACHIAGSRALIDGLESIRKCSAGLNAYWDSFVLPVAMGGYQPDLAFGFQQFMRAPHIEKAMAEFVAQESSQERVSAFDSHPSLGKRIELARGYDRPMPADTRIDTSLPMISLIDELEAVQAAILRKVLPNIPAAELKPLNWETAGADIYVPSWREQVAPFLTFLASRKMSELPQLILDPRPVAKLVPNPSEGRMPQAQRMAIAIDVLFCAFALTLMDNGWSLITSPGVLQLQNGDASIDPASVIGLIQSGGLSIVEWRTFRAERSIGDWPLATMPAELGAEVKDLVPDAVR
ncbi:M48 family metalloprotease [Occallatibacter savannae]|uniref:M48 family metalloprotease n=1 Tax=Occallatibacter savannae TaxID=1002691 RepID=UPI0013A54613|nr:M48 family metallopeptidase [Occallatibacter savannae]